MNRSTPLVAWILALAALVSISTGGLQYADALPHHVHPLLAVVILALSVTMAVLSWPTRLRWWGPSLPVACLCQSLLGGLRGLDSDPYLVIAHGCAAPILLAMCATSISLTRPARVETDGQGRYPAVLAAVAIFVQIVASVHLRHLPPDAGWFLPWLWSHGIALVVAISSAGWLHLRQRSLRPARLLVVLLLIQIVLSMATWVVHYGFPAWFRELATDPGYTIIAGGPLQIATTTAYIATGSLCLAVACTLVVGGTSQAQPGRPDQGA